MKKYIHYTSAVLVTGTLIASLALAEDKSAKPDAQTQEMMKKMEAAGTPGPAHKALEPLVGNWDAEVKMWNAPDAPPTVNKGSAKSTWAMNGRFVQQEFNGEFMGKPFRGLGFTGYDNTKKEYNSVWIDDMNTAMHTSEGKADQGGKVITLEGKYDCPLTGEKDKASKQVYRIVSRDKVVFEMHDPAKGANSKTMEITYTRKS
jgi:Protein of unknown function (DUF1579)